MSEHRLALETRAAQILKSALMEVTDDPDTLADTIEGATNLHEAIAAVMGGIDDDEALAVGIDVIIAQFKERGKRIEARLERRRNAIERAMMAGELMKLELPQATLSLRKVPPKLEIVSEDMLPKTYFETVPKLKRTELWADVKAGKDIPGARLTNGGQALSIRRA